MEKIQKQVPILQIITGAMTVFLGVLVVVAHIMSEGNGTSEEDLALTLIMIGSSGLLLLAGAFAKGILLKAHADRLKDEESIDPYIEAYTAAHILGLVLREAGVIAAFVICLFTEETSWVLIAAAIGILLNLSDLPNESKIRQFIPQRLLQP
ncbi:hypothetical protein MRY87_02440 [bacterium]|nr:hypothetical protein [bacterium]